MVELNWHLNTKNHFCINNLFSLFFCIVEFILDARFPEKSLKS